jgi:hypothetical protein
VACGAGFKPTPLHFFMRWLMSGLKPGPISEARANAGILRCVQNDKRKVPGLKAPLVLVRFSAA